MLVCAFYRVKMVDMPEKENEEKAANQGGFKYLRRLLLTVFLLSLIFATGYVIGLKGFYARLSQFPKVTISRELPPDKKNLDFSLFWRVWDTLDKKYYDKSKLIPAQMVYGAIRGMVASVGDPYTVFLEPKENKIVQEDLSGSFSGVGIQIGFKGTQLAVIAPIPSSPAESAGVKAGDYIVGIKDNTKGIDRGTVGITLPEAVEEIRGKAGTKVTLTLVRDGVDEPFEADITRSTLDVPSVITSWVGENGTIARVQITTFSSDTPFEWEDTVAQVLKNPNLSGIIIDLRNNPGGYLEAAVDLASDFIETGKVVVSEDDGNGQKQDYKVEKLGRLKNEKVVVLVNEGSASASEIVAGALRDNKGTQLVGSETFGKGTIQEPEDIDNGAGLHITIAKWLTPSGYWVNGEGLKPDVEITDNTDTSEDEQLQAAIKLLE